MVSCESSPFILLIAFGRTILTNKHAIEQVLQEPEARSLGERVAGGITQRLAARLLQQVLKSPAPPQ